LLHRFGYITAPSRVLPWRLRRTSALAAHLRPAAHVIRAKIAHCRHLLLLWRLHIRELLLDRLCLHRILSGLHLLGNRTQSTCRWAASLSNLGCCRL